jgi:hypothetical protein
VCALGPLGLPLVDKLRGGSGTAGDTRLDGICRGVPLKALARAKQLGSRGRAHWWRETDGPENRPPSRLRLFPPAQPRQMRLPAMYFRLAIVPKGSFFPILRIFATIRVAPAGLRPLGGPSQSGPRIGQAERWNWSHQPGRASPRLRPAAGHQPGLQPGRISRGALAPG